jgi:hypothetical protein
MAFMIADARGTKDKRRECEPDSLPHPRKKVLRNKGEELKSGTRLPSIKYLSTQA